MSEAFFGVPNETSSVLDRLKALKSGEDSEQREAKFNSQLLREINKTLYLQMKQGASTRSNLSENLDRFFDLLLALEQASLIQKKDIMNAYFELFECAQEPHLLPLFDMMVKKLFPGQGGFFQGASEREQNILINFCSKVCKAIMKKLSATHETEFRGKIQRFIATIFPLTHASGLNKIGHYNVKNTTNVDGPEEIKEQIKQQKQGGKDVREYRNFWSL